MRPQRTVQIVLYPALMILSGCAVVQSIARIPTHVFQRAEKKVGLLEERCLDAEAVHQAKLAEADADRNYLKQSRNALVAEQHLKRQMEMNQTDDRLKLMEAENRMVYDATRPRYRDKLSSQLQLDVGQSFEVGQLQVNPEKLKEILASHERAYEQAVREWEADEAKRLKLQDPADCARPARQKLTDSRPTPKPLLPTEIPLMLPVSLVMEVGNPAVGQPEVKREPMRSKLQECTAPDGGPLKLIDAPPACCSPGCCTAPPGTVCPNCTSIRVNDAKKK